MHCLLPLGFSSGVNPDDFKGNWDSGYDPLWEDMLEKHHLQPYHCMVGGGDQIYCDALTLEPEMQCGWSESLARGELTPIQRGSMLPIARPSSRIR